MVAASEHARTVTHSPYGIWGLAAISFIESALPAPLITDPFLLAYILARREDTLRAVLVTTASSVAGGVAGYFIAVGFFEVVVTPFLSSDALSEIYAISERFEEGSFLLSLTGAVTPLPYTFVAIAAGVVQANLILFILGSTLGRLFRYGFEGWVMYRFGTQALAIIRRQIVLTTLILTVLVGLYIFYALS